MVFLVQLTGDFSRLRSGYPPEVLSHIYKVAELKEGLNIVE